MHKRLRLDFAKAHKDWTSSQWAQVVFSDESRFLLYRSDGRIFIRRRKGEEFNDECIRKTVKHGGGGIMVWGCITPKGVGFLEKVNGRLNAEGYIDILGNALIPSLHYHGMHECTRDQFFLTASVCYVYLWETAAADDPML